MASENVQQSTNLNKTVVYTYTNSDGLLEKKQIVLNEANGLKIKEAIWVDNDKSGTFDKNELKSITIFGYTKDGRYAASKTYNDVNSDGYCDVKSQQKYYIKQDNGEYKLDYETLVSEVSAEEIEQYYSNIDRLPKIVREKVQKFKERLNMQNKNNNYKEESKRVSEIIQTEAYNYDTYGNW